jgi:acetyl-CoA synthetase
MEAFGQLHGLSDKLIFAAHLALEELFVSIVSHAFEDSREHVVEIGLSLKDRRLIITLVDDGRAFDPTTVPDKPTDRLSAEDIEHMELGLRMVRKVVDTLTYERRDGRNRLTLVLEDIPDKQSITSVSRKDPVFPPPDIFRKNARLQHMDEYRRIYRKSIYSPKMFWAQPANELDWFRKWDTVLEENFREGIHRWFVGGKLNVTVNCLDRHLNSGRRNNAALIWEGERPGEEKTLTFLQLHRQVCRFANVLKRHGVKKGERVCLYLPMIPELAIAMLACARIGAVHTVVYDGSDAEILKIRIMETQPRLLICSNGLSAGGRFSGKKDAVDAALLSCPGIIDVIVVRRTGGESSIKQGRDFWWDQEISHPDISNDCPAEAMDAEDPLFIQYTGAPSDRPYGVVHTTAGYLVYAMQTCKWIFDIREEDIFWCTADIGWRCGHAYTVYGPLVNGTTSLLFEGRPNPYSPDRFWEIIEKYGVTIFYASVRTLHSLMETGHHRPEQHDLNTLRLLGSTGAPLDSPLWIWCRDIVGRSRCPIVETWWQAETGGIVIGTIPGAMPAKPGSVAQPFFGIEPKIIRSPLAHTDFDSDGWLVFSRPWPGLMRSIYGHPTLHKRIYFTKFPDSFAPGIRAGTDADGYFHIDSQDETIPSIMTFPDPAEAEIFAAPKPFYVESVGVGLIRPGGGQDIQTYMTLKMDIQQRNDLISAYKNQRHALAGYQGASQVVRTVTYQA